VIAHGEQGVRRSLDLHPALRDLGEQLGGREHVLRELVDAPGDQDRPGERDAAQREQDEEGERAVELDLGGEPEVSEHGAASGRRGPGAARRGAAPGGAG